MGAYIATQDIAVGEVNAYTRGQRVEAEAIKANGWEDLVVGEHTKEGREIKAVVTGRPVEDFETTATTTSSRGTAAKSTSTQEG